MPTAAALLKSVGYSPEEIARIEAGAVVRRETRGAGDRDLNIGLAFLAKEPPATLSKLLKGGVLLTMDPNNLANGTLTGDGSVTALAKLSLMPNAAERAQRYLTAEPGSQLNLSTDELAELDVLGDTATVPAVEAQLRQALLKRYNAYRAQGLAGIIAYDRGGGVLRSPGNELREVMKGLELQHYAPKAWAAMKNYPGSRVAGTEEVFRWEHFKANGVPTIALSHSMAVPDGGAFLLLQRQFYVSEGFNCEQAILALLPVEGGTMVIFSNHTSTDQVDGFASGIKRAVGRDMVEAQLQPLFAKLQRRIE